VSTDVVEPSKWRKRIWRLTIISTLIGILFAVGAAIVGFLAIRVVTGMMMGMIGMASASTLATTNGLYYGDSATRLTVLTQLKHAFDEQPTMTFDVPTAEWILPAVDHCKTDIDLEVVALAEELASYINERTTHPPP
jgi:hypothetical protein